MRRWKGLPAHHISDAPAMKGYSRRTSGKGSPALFPGMAPADSGQAQESLPAHRPSGAPVENLLLPAHPWAGAPAMILGPGPGAIMVIEMSESIVMRYLKHRSKQRFNGDRSRRLIGLSQSTYLDKILKKFRMDESKKGFLPMLPGKVLSKTQGPATAEERERMNQIPYASAVGSIIYQSDPGMEHWTTVKNILKYLKRTKDMFLCYGGDQELVVTSYTDASWNTDPDDSKSQSGYVFILNGAAVSWCSSKQCTVAKSSTESEYIAASEASSEAVWMKRFIVELGVVPSALDPLVIYCDNMGAIANAQEPRSHKKLKHIKLRFHSIREYIEDGEVKICKVHTDLNVADPLTKALPRAKHDQHQNAMGVSNNKSASDLEVMLKDFISKQTAFNKYVEEKFGNIDVLASKVDSLAHDVEFIKLKKPSPNGKPALEGIIQDLPHLLGDVDLVQHHLDRLHAQIHWNVFSLGEVSSEVMNEDLLALRDECIQLLHQQRRQLNVTVAVLVVFRAVARIRSRSRFIPGVLLASASVVAVPRFGTFMRLSVLMLRFLLVSDRLRLRRAPRGSLGGAAVQEPREVARPDDGFPPGL
ncbi:hypothetical protein QYE76_054748 [Lolium multiflorum]|uniref:Retrotransposon protein, putative, Ty1-copia subclass n=1 Tax=Lolium multiflorum TaxID=4521 RepID=A0AAD8SYX1_LOLMU|nr:hypothetical protein QYE76_054748 [Lolium multiflorum]